nr:TetR/AcrR family transcriptional regulator [bacterium]
MPPKAKFTKEEIVAAAVDIIRTSNVEDITAQALAKRLGTSTRPVFTYFSTLEELRAAATEEARRIYNTYAERGLAMTPAFKGFAMEYIGFAIQEPSLFRLLFMRKAKTMSLFEFLDREGHLYPIRQAVQATFHLDQEQADWLYENMWTYAHGIATLCASEVVSFTREEISEKLGSLCRGLLMNLHAPKDPRTAVMPGKDTVIAGSMDDYTKAL